MIRLVLWLQAKNISVNFVGGNGFFNLGFVHHWAAVLQKLLSKPFPVIWGEESAQECLLYCINSGRPICCNEEAAGLKCCFWDVCARVCVCVGGFGWKLDLRFPLLSIMPLLLWLQIRRWNWSSQSSCSPLSGRPESSLLFLLPLKLSSCFSSRPGPGRFHLLIWLKRATNTPSPELARPSRRQYSRIFFDIRSSACRDRKSSVGICVK